MLDISTSISFLPAPPRVAICVFIRKNRKYDICPSCLWKSPTPTSHLSQIYSLSNFHWKLRGAILRDKTKYCLGLPWLLLAWGHSPLASWTWPFCMEPQCIASRTETLSDGVITWVVTSSGWQDLWSGNIGIVRERIKVSNQWSIKRQNVVVYMSSSVWNVRIIFFFILFCV